MNKFTTNFEESFLVCYKSLDDFPDFINRDYFRLMFKADHIGYKCSVHEEYEVIKEFLLGDPNRGNVLIEEKMISGRLISFIKLGMVDAKGSRSGIFWYLELQDQKLDFSQQSGFDHYELVPYKISFKNVGNELRRLGFSAEIDEKPHHTTWLVDHPDAKPNHPKIKIAAEPLINKIKRETAGV